MQVRARLVAVIAIVIILVSSLALLVEKPPPNDGPSSGDGNRNIDVSYSISGEDQRVVAVNKTNGRAEHGPGSMADVLQSTIDGLVSGGTILIESGRYDVDRDVVLKGNIQLRGEGMQKTILSSADRRLLIVNGVSDIHISDIGLTGSCALYIIAGTSDVKNITIQNVSATVSEKVSAAFTLDSSGKIISDVTFVGCRAIDCGAYGFLNIGSKGGGLVRNITYQDCIADGNGISKRSHDWVVGFDLAELTDVDGMMLINCSASNNWESGFHFEEDVTIRDVTFDHCTANNNGVVKVDPLYGSGFVLNGHATLIECTARGDRNGGVMLLGDPSTISIEGGDLDMGPMT